MPPGPLPALQQAPQILQPEAGRWRADTTRQRHRLEGLAHLAGHQQFARLGRHSRALRAIGRREDVLFDAAGQQEGRLRVQ